jgi:hypothetical protein
MHARQVLYHLPNHLLNVLPLNTVDLVIKFLKRELQQWILAFIVPSHLGWNNHLSSDTTLTYTFIHLWRSHPTKRRAAWGSGITVESLASRQYLALSRCSAHTC